MWPEQCHTSQGGRPRPRVSSGLWAGVWHPPGAVLGLFPGLDHAWSLVSQGCERCSEQGPHLGRSHTSRPHLAPAPTLAAGSDCRESQASWRCSRSAPQPLAPLPGPLFLASLLKPPLLSWALTEVFVKNQGVRRWSTPAPSLHLPHLSSCASPLAHRQCPCRPPTCCLEPIPFPARSSSPAVPPSPLPCLQTPRPTNQQLPVSQNPAHPAPRTA